jgi:predicted ATPase
MIPAADRPAFHLRLGRVLARRLDPSDSQTLFDAVGHLNAAGDLVSDPEERLDVARMNLKAASRAEDSAAFGAALRYIERGLAWLPGDAWASHYRLRLDFATKKGVLQSLCDQHDDALATLADAFDNAGGRLDQTLVRRLRMNVQVLKNDLPAALAEGLEALRPFGINLVRDPDERALDAQFTATMALMEGRSFDSILELPELDDPELCALCDVLKELFSPARGHVWRLRPTLEGGIPRVSRVTPPRHPRRARRGPIHLGVLLRRQRVHEQPPTRRADRQHHRRGARLPGGPAPRQVQRDHLDGQRRRPDLREP